MHYAKPDFSDEDGIRAAELEEKFGRDGRGGMLKSDAAQLPFSLASWSSTTTR